MQFTNSKATYGWVSILLHWSIALAILALFVLGVWMVELDYYSDWYHQAPWIHKSAGVLVVLAMLLRFIWNQSNNKPQALAKGVQHGIARLVHFVLYLLVILLGISGYLISTAESAPISVFDWFEIPALIEPFEGQADLAGEIHEWLAYSLMALVGLHALAALKHHFWDRDATLKRMLLPN